MKADCWRIDAFNCGIREDLMDLSLSKLWEILKDREVWHAALHKVAKNWTQLSNWTVTKTLNFELVNMNLMLRVFLSVCLSSENFLSRKLHENPPNQWRLRVKSHSNQWTLDICEEYHGKLGEVGRGRQAQWARQTKRRWPLSREGTSHLKIGQRVFPREESAGAKALGCCRTELPWGIRRHWWPMWAGASSFTKEWNKTILGLNYITCPQHMLCYSAHTLCTWNTGPTCYYTLDLLEAFTSCLLHLLLEVHAWFWGMYWFLWSSWVVLGKHRLLGENKMNTLHLFRNGERSYWGGQVNTAW